MELCTDDSKKENRWLFTKEQLQTSFENDSSYDGETRMSQFAAQFIQDMGQRLQVKQLAISTAIVYMRRFAVFQPVYETPQFSDKRIYRYALAAACLFLSAKVEEQPRKLDHIVRTAYFLKERKQLQQKTELYDQKCQELLLVENLLLQVLGFDIGVDHSHYHVVKLCLHKAPKDFIEKAYMYCTHSLILTNFCLRYTPQIIAAASIMMTAKEMKIEFPIEKQWYAKISSDLTPAILADICREFLEILERSPAKLRKRSVLSSNLNPSEKPTATSSNLHVTPPIGPGCDMSKVSGNVSHAANPPLSHLAMNTSMLQLPQSLQLSSTLSQSEVLVVPVRCVPGAVRPWDAVALTSVPVDPSALLTPFLTSQASASYIPLASTNVWNFGRHPNTLCCAVFWTETY